MGLKAAKHIISIAAWNFQHESAESLKLHFLYLNHAGSSHLCQDGPSHHQDLQVCRHHWPWLAHSMSINIMTPPEIIKLWAFGHVISLKMLIIVENRVFHILFRT